MRQILLTSFWCAYTAVIATLAIDSSVQNGYCDDYDPATQVICSSRIAWGYAGMTLSTFYLLMLSSHACVEYQIIQRVWFVCSMCLCSSILVYIFGGFIIFIFLKLSRVLAGIWLCFQSFVILDIAHFLHVTLLGSSMSSSRPKITSRKMHHLLHIFASAATASIDYTFAHYLIDGRVSCYWQILVAEFIVLIGSVMILFSLTSWCNKGILTPMLFLLWVLISCFYAFLSNPTVSCNPSAGTNNSTAKLVMKFVMLFLFVVTVQNGVKIWSKGVTRVIEIIRGR